MKFNELLRTLRKMKGYTLVQVEEAVGISNAYLSQLETGKVKNPSVGFLYKLAKMYEVPYEVLMKAAGYIESTEDVSNRLLGMAFSKTETFSPEDTNKVMQFVSFLREGRSKDNSKKVSYSLENTPLELKRYASQILNQAGVFDITPIPIDDILRTTKLKREGDVDLHSVVEHIYKKTGNWIDSGLQKILGMLDYHNNTIYVSPEIHQKKDRFVTSCYSVAQRTILC